MTKVIVIDDDRMVRLIVEKGLNSIGIHVISASLAMDGLQLVETEKPDVALVDVSLPEMNGFELFRKIRAIDSKIPMIFVTSDVSSETTIEAMRLGAFDYLAKPVNLDQLRKMTLSAITARRLMDEPVVLKLSGEGTKEDQFIGRSDLMLGVFKSIGRVSGSNATVLIRGESGCGKELVARAILQHSDRNNKPYTAVNCAAIPDQLLESELFGHEKGAFTGADQRRKGKFEQCHGGTIFLDEVGDMSLLIQGKVLRLIQDQRFQRLGSNDEISTNVRVIAATNRNLEEMVKKGLFREDLLYRLNGYTIELPPLRDRPEDISSLVEYFLKRERREMGKMSIQGLSPPALETLVQYEWPGNVRQLQSVIRHAVLHTTGTVLTPESLPSFVLERKSSSNPEVGISLQEEIKSRVPSEEADGSPDLGMFIDRRLSHGSTDLYKETIEEVERYLFMRTLNDTNGNQSKAADILGITRGKVRDRIAYFGIVLDHAVSTKS